MVSAPREFARSSRLERWAAWSFCAAPLAALLVAAVIPGPGFASAAAEAPISGASLLARYASLESYCDAGTRIPGIGERGSLVFERCAHRDGRFRRVEREKERRYVGATWADAQTYYFYQVLGSTTYWESPLDHHRFDWRYRDRDQIFPMFLFEIFPGGSVRNTNELTAYMAAFTANRELSNDRFTVLERSEAEPGGRAAPRERFWVLNADRTIRKYESFGGRGTRIVEISSVETNRPLSESDLRFHAPLLARYSFSVRPWVFTSALMILAAALGVAFWTWSFIRRAMDETLATRKRLWRLHFKTLGWSAAALAVLTLLSLPGGGHPPPIVFVYVLAIWCAILLGLAACFLLASYPMELLFRQVASQRKSS